MEVLNGKTAGKKIRFSAEKCRSFKEELFYCYNQAYCMPMEGGAGTVIKELLL
jgi:hypothetical protein